MYCTRIAFGMLLVGLRGKWGFSGVSERKKSKLVLLTVAFLLLDGMVCPVLPRRKPHLAFLFIVRSSKYDRNDYAHQDRTRRRHSTSRSHSSCPSRQRRWMRRVSL